MQIRQATVIGPEGSQQWRAPRPCPRSYWPTSVTMCYKGSTATMLFGTVMGIPHHVTVRTLAVLLAQGWPAHPTGVSSTFGAEWRHSRCGGHLYMPSEQRNRNLAGLRVTSRARNRTFGKSTEPLQSSNTYWTIAPKGHGRSKTRLTQRDSNNLEFQVLKNIY